MSLLSHLDQALFLQLHATTQPTPVAYAMAWFCAQALIGIVPLVLTWRWLRADHPAGRLVLLDAALAAALALALAQLIGWAWPHPRPFAMGLGGNWLAHAADASFPSDHLTVLSAVAWRLLGARDSRRSGIGLMALAPPMGWARVYLGAHFPLDIVGGVMVGLLGALLAAGVQPALRPLLAATEALHRRMFAPWIRRGWVRP